MRLTLFVSGLYLLFACVGAVPSAESSITCISSHTTDRKFAVQKNPWESTHPEVLATSTGRPTAAAIPAAPPVVASTAATAFTLSDRGPPAV